MSGRPTDGLQISPRGSLEKPQQSSKEPRRRQRTALCPSAARIRPFLQRRQRIALWSRFINLLVNEGHNGRKDLNHTEATERRNCKKRTRSPNPIPLRSPSVHSLC